MVRVNFRINNGIENNQILQFFKGIGYEHIRSNNKSIKAENEVIQFNESLFNCVIEFKFRFH